MIEKTCTKCGAVKPLDEFHRHGTGRHGRRAACRGCRAAYHAEWLAKNRDRRAEYMAKYNAEYRAKNRAHIAEYRAEYRDRRAELDANRPYDLNRRMQATLQKAAGAVERAIQKAEEAA